MQIVIDIDERDYETAKRWGKIGEWTTVDCIMEAIANGTPLPKHHGRLIDADAYREAWFNSRKFEPMLLLDFAPTVIEADKEAQECQPNS